MITSLHIKNIGIIDEITVNLNEGFNVLTGETGAGKTLIIDALSIICGDRFSKEMIRKDKDYSFVEACLYLPNSLYSEDSNVIVSREIYSNGKNLCKINGRFVTVSELREFMKNHIDIHGQNDNQKIMDVTTHIDYLDSFSDELKEEKEEYKSLYNEYMTLKAELKLNYEDDKEKQRTLDLLEYQLNEIDDANLKIDEEEYLEETKKKIQNMEKISSALNNSSMILNDTTLDSINEVLKSLSKIEDLDINYSKKYSELQSVYYDLEEIKKELDGLNYDNYFDEQEANNVFERLDLIYNLKRKYGNDVEEILKYRNEIREKIESIKNLENYTQDLKLKLDNLNQIMNEKAINIDKIRRNKAVILEKRINKELEELEMKNAKFKINIENEKEFNINGLNKVEFLVCTNVGEDFKPLVKIASGGEISRIMLSIKSVLSEKDLVDTCIFDEVDTGISGKASKSVALKLNKISKSHQIICVTHSSIIAAASDYHYYISKSSDKNSTKTQVGLLDSDKSIEEIAKISSGIVNEMTKNYALELRNQFKIV